MVTKLTPSSGAPQTVWLRFDDAWDFRFSPSFDAPVCIDASSVGPSLRFITKRSVIEAFFTAFGERFRPFILSGSGDFHHLTAVFIRQIKEPFAILSFDNHPDWDIRPPYWSCGAWVNRSFENPLVEKVAVWGCGSFECTFPWRLLGNRAACRSGRLWIAPRQRKGRDYPPWLHPVESVNWRANFTNFVESIQQLPLYITVDLDCLGENESVTNWENGRFTVSDIVWAIALLRQKVRIVGGDLCGAFSKSRYGSVFQALAGRFDHPRQRSVGEEARRSINRRALEAVWPCLVGELPTR
jgi:arginase family enzyme